MLKSRIIGRRKHKTPAGLIVEAICRSTIGEYMHLHVKVNGSEVIVIGNIKKKDFRFDTEGSIRVNRDGHYAHFVKIRAKGLDNLTAGSSVT